jgi:superfamily I DNA/RNA helicase
MVQERLQREGFDRPPEILVLTFNRTLSRYIHLLISEQIKGAAAAELTVDTFAKWAMSHLGCPKVVANKTRDARIQLLGKQLPLSPRYIAGEVDYLLGRFERTDLERYITEERTGRGAEPRVDRALRRRILDEVVSPYHTYLDKNGLLDWNELAVQMRHSDRKLQYDIVIVDESQDFSANQLRAIRSHLRPEHAITFVIDTLQRIYSRGFTWQEIGFDPRGVRYRTLTENHRNTRQIARFAAGILS